MMLIEFSMSSPSGKSNNSCLSIVRSYECFVIDMIACALLISSTKENGSTNTIKYNAKAGAFWFTDLSIAQDKNALIRQGDVICFSMLRYMEIKFTT